MEYEYVYPGTFAPPTYGHLRIVEKAADMFPQVTVLCSHNAEKGGRWFDEETCRRMWLSYSLPKNVEVVTFKTFMERQRKGSKTIMLRGVRDESDYDHEKNVLFSNYIAFGIDTCCYFIAEPEYADISSSAAREMAERLDFESLCKFVSPSIVEELHRRANTTKGLWRRFAKQIGIPDQDLDESFRALEEKYSAPPRYYHTLDGHIRWCIKLFEKVRHIAADPLAVEATLWMHDAHYDSKASDNEEQSAVWMRLFFERFGGGDIDKKFIDRVAELIAITTHKEMPNNNDEQLIVDVDLAILGAPPAEFDQYEIDIRYEYDWVPWPIFAKKRAEILQEFLDRQTIYHHKFFLENHEQQAMENLSRSIQKLDRLR